MTSNLSGDDFPAVFPTAIPEVPPELWARLLEHAVDPTSQALPGLVPDDDLAAMWADDAQATGEDAAVGADADGEPGADPGLDHPGLDHPGLDHPGLDHDDARPLADHAHDGGPTWHAGDGDGHEPGDAW